MTVNSTNPIVLRAAASAYVVLGTIFGFMSLMAGLAASSDRSMRPAFAACAVAWIISYIWLSRFQIVVGADSLIYRSLFGGTTEFRFTEIRNLVVESGIRDYSDRFKPFVRLVITPSRELHAKPLYINLKVLGASGVRQLLDALRVKYDTIGRPDVVRNL